MVEAGNTCARGMSTKKADSVPARRDYDRAPTILIELPAGAFRRSRTEFRQRLIDQL
jgi:hypothetical protein